MTEPNGYMASLQSRTFFSNAFAFIESHGTNMYINIKQKTKPSEKSILTEALFVGHVTNALSQEVQENKLIKKDCES